MDVWIIQDFDSFLNDSQYNGFVVVESVPETYINELVKTCTQSGRTVIVKPVVGRCSNG